MNKAVSLLLLTAFLGVIASPSFAVDTAAKQAFMMDATTHTVMLNKDGDVEMHPSSMSKLMTLYVLFSRLKEGRVKLDDKFTISEKAWRTQGSKTFVHVGGEITVEDLIHGIIIQSGNDACIVVAEGISGTEEAFAEEMNRIAKDIGLTGSHFVNATGLPEDNHLMTAHDLAILADRLIKDFPEYYHYFSLREYTYNNIKQQNRNRLLGNNIGVDGLKTGHTEAAGYGITLSAKQGDRRLLLVMNGLESDNQRVEEGDKLLRWGFREFENKKLLSKGQIVGEADVFFGTQDTVKLVASDDMVLTLPISAQKNMNAKLRYMGPVPAPIEQGTHIADLVLTADGVDQTVPLVAGESVGKMSGFKRMLSIVKYTVTGRH
jgi:serine-type D-Ala-D-Ala carboxypeptidase (penicillin-binding protein 5/6)